MPRLSLHLFGPPRVLLEGRPLSLGRRKALALLAYLAAPAAAVAIRNGHAHTRQALAALLWPDYPEPSALAYLRRALWELNQALGPGIISAERDVVQLDREADVIVDVVRFRACLAAGMGRPCPDSLPLLEEAAALYTGDFLAGFSLKDAPAFDEWTLFQSEALRREAGQLFERYVGCLAAAGQAVAALPVAQRWLLLDQLNEAAHRVLMQLYAQAGQSAAALRQYQALSGLLQAELGVAPQPETTALYDQVRAGPAAPSAAAPRPALSPDPSRRPAVGTAQALAHGGHEPKAPEPLLAYPNTFVGREAELAEIARRLAEPACRLLTLTGPGGTGKTRLAVQAAEAQRALFADGVFFVPLSAVAEPGLIVPALAGALGLVFHAGPAAPGVEQKTDHLLNFLRAKHLLLVLDNFEQLLAEPVSAEATRLLADLLAAAPRLKLLVTSRERLNLQEEWPVPIDGLDAPSASSGDQPLEAFEAVNLFLQSARRASASLAFSQDDLAQVVRICRLLEGLPLGLELAAAWTRALTPREIADEIERGLDFLTTPLRDAPARHRSLAAVFDYSWQLLPPFDQDPLRRLSVFVGSFQRESAQAVAGAGLATLASLVDKSLLYRRASGRYELHTLVRQYAGARLAAEPAVAAETLARHSRYFAGYLKSHGANLHAHGQREALDALGVEIDNLRAGWLWALEQRDLPLIDTYLGSLFWFYDLRSRAPEGADLAAQSVAALPPVASRTVEERRIAALLQAWFGHFSNRLGRIYAGDPALREALLSLRSLAPPSRPAEALGAMLVLQWMGFDADTLVGIEGLDILLDDTLAYYQAQGMRWAVAQMLALKGIGLDGPVDEIRRLYLESIQLNREVGNRLAAARTLIWLGEVYHHTGEYEAALRCFEENQAIGREFNDRWSMSMSLDHAGYVARRLGDYALARARHVESLELSKAVGDQLGEAGSLDNLGLVALELGDLDEAGWFFQSALELRRASGHPWSLAVSLDHIGALALARGDLAAAELALLEAGTTSPSWLEPRIHLGRLRFLQGRAAEALAILRQALDELVQLSDLPLALAALAALAEVHQGQREYRRAAEILGLLLEHPATEHIVREAARHQLEALARLAPPEVVGPALERGRLSSPAAQRDREAAAVASS